MKVFCSLVSNIGNYAIGIWLRTMGGGVGVNYSER